MSFTEFKTKVMKIARKNRVAYKIPGDNTLFRIWEKKVTPENVVSFVQNKTSLYECLECENGRKCAPVDCGVCSKKL